MADLNFRENAVGAQAKIVLTLTFANGRTDLDDVNTVTFWFQKKDDPDTVVELAGAVEDSATMKVSLTLAEGDWTSFANVESWLLTVDLETDDASVIPIPEAAKGYTVKFHQHPNGV